MIILEEATTEQIIEELDKRSEHMTIFINIPQNDSQFTTKFKGNFIERVGMVNLLKNEIDAMDFYYQQNRLKSMDEDSEENEF